MSDLEAYFDTPLGGGKRVTVEPIEVSPARHADFVVDPPCLRNADEKAIADKVLDPKSGLMDVLLEVLADESLARDALSGAKAFGASAYPRLFMTCDKACVDVIRTKVFERMGVHARIVTGRWKGPMTDVCGAAYTKREVLHSVIALSTRAMDFRPQRDPRPRPLGVVLFDPTYVQFVGGDVALDECICDAIQAISCKDF